MALITYKNLKHANTSTGFTFVRCDDEECRGEHSDSTWDYIYCRNLRVERTQDGVCWLRVNRCDGKEDEYLLNMREVSSWQEG